MLPVLIALLAGAALAAPPPKSSPIDFQREIRPILSGNCFQCHGPDKNTRMTGLRLDLKEDVFAPRKNGAAVVPGKPEESALFKRLSETGALRMPPAHSRKSVTDSQRALLRRWIEQGAPWTQHWAFVAPVRSEPPSVKDAKWARNPIDRFVLAKLEAAGLKPAPEAGRRTLARRVSLDITGLPPEPELVEAFVRDKPADAYESLVSKLLASQRYGEHRARYWLDAARYADTHGIHVDNYREMWPYRDWVIGAFNRNLPFDKFTIEQIAGDLLPDATLDQKIASGFHRCNVTTNEAGVIVEEVEAIYAKDRVDTTGTIWLGLTIGCSTCHDHKFDPISQRDFYSMAAFFRNTTQNAMDDNIPDTPPIVVAPAAADRPRWEALAGEEAAARAEMAKRRREADPTWLAGGARVSANAPLEGQVFALDAATQALSSGVTRGEGPGPGAPALRFDKGESLDLPAVTIDADKPFSIAAAFFFPKGEEGFSVASQNDPKDKGRGWQIDIGARVVNFRMVGDDGKAITIRAGHMEQLTPGTWNRVAISYDGTREQAGLALFLNGKPLPAQGAGDQNTKLPGSILVKEPLKLGRNLPGGAISDFRVFSRAMAAEEALLVSMWPALAAGRSKDAASLTADERDGWRLYQLWRQDDAYRGVAAKLASMASERREIRRRGAVTLVMNERTDRKPFANILYRGMYDQPRDRVEPNTPAVLPPMSASLPRNRLGLAHWLVDPAHPLTTRVTVNRLWQEIFGEGLVKSAEDFGSQGFAPANRELLDWLAVEFRESGWDVKKLVTLMVTSATYRQSAVTTKEKLEKDPANTLLSRGPRFRMDAEMVRDFALASSGLLRPEIGGPSARPYQPDGIWEAVAMAGSNTRFYKRDEGGNLYRRSLYTFWKRSAPPPSMDIFNAPTREACAARRERTNTPLQALVVMNDTQFVEAARRLAENAMRASKEPETQAAALSARLLARPLEPRERSILQRAYREFLRYYDSHPDDAAKLLAVGDSPAPADLDKAKLAALTMAANEMMNLDEALNK